MSIANTYAASTYLTSGSGSTSSSKDSTGTTSQTLDQNDFLNLLVIQLKNQNPLEPMSNTDFIAQMAQFSSLQQLQNLNTNFENLNTNFVQLYLANLLSYSASLLGKTVEAEDPATNQSYSGQVTGYSIQDNQVYLTVDGAQIKPSWITNVSASSS